MKRQKKSQIIMKELADEPAVLGQNSCQEDGWQTVEELIDTTPSGPNPKCSGFCNEKNWWVTSTGESKKI